MRHLYTSFKKKFDEGNILRHLMMVASKLTYFGDGKML